MKNGAPQLDAWRRSAAWREISSRQARKMLAEHASKPRCGAKTRSGAPCQEHAMTGRTRCWRHGGRTPKGAAWHQPIFSADERKLSRKLKRQEKAAGKKARRLKLMGPERRAAYERWLAAHQPTSAADRERRRQERSSAKWLKRLQGGQSQDPGGDALRAKLAALEAERDRLLAPPRNVFD